MCFIQVNLWAVVMGVTFKCGGLHVVNHSVLLLKNFWSVTLSWHILKNPGFVLIAVIHPVPVFFYKL